MRRGVGSSAPHPLFVSPRAAGRGTSRVAAQVGSNGIFSALSAAVSAAAQGARAQCEATTHATRVPAWPVLNGAYPGRLLAPLLRLSALLCAVAPPASSTWRGATDRAAYPAR